MSEMPIAYRKILEYLKENQGRSRSEQEYDLSARFRLTREEIRQAIEEMRQWGLDFEKTQRRLKIKDDKP